MGFELREFAVTDGLFLGVENSATGRAWRDRLDERGSARALAIAQRHDLPELLARILAGRNVEGRRGGGVSRPDDQAIDARSERADRHAGGRRAHRRRHRARRERSPSSAITTSTAPLPPLLARFLRRAGIEPLIHIPDRLFEGYGPNVEAVRALAARGATLW
jgi:single-stranded-DNA-specific exonuclease